MINYTLPMHSGLSWRQDEIMQLLPLNLEKITLIGHASNVPRVVEAAQQVLAGSSFPSKCLEVLCW
jgi:hypothetical protein